MKLKTQELIRGLELYSYLGISLACTIFSSNLDIESLKQISQFLQENEMDLAKIKMIMSNIYYLDSLTSYRSQTLTKEYKQLNELYKETIKNTAELYKDFGVEHPVCIFAMYVYMYRKGYFSYDKQFKYSVKMKDFAKLNGLDVIRGYGVCRSISSMLTDIYREMNMSSYNLAVNTDSKTISNFEKLCPVTLEKDNNKTTSFVKVVSLITKILPLSNHLITMVEKDGLNYIFDPTNDGFLYKGNINHLLVSNCQDYYMRKRESILLNLIGQYSDGVNIFKQNKQLALPTISFERYKELYTRTIDLCLNNQDMFEKFYLENLEYINDIHGISEEQRGLVKRLFPFDIMKSFR